VGTLRKEWGSDFFGALNELPPQAVDGLAQVLEAMGTQRTFKEARVNLLKDLQLPKNGKLLEVGCGTGVSLQDVSAVYGQPALVGIDFTSRFIDHARERARKLGFVNATYVQGDARETKLGDNEFDSTFADKLLLHIGPCEAVLEEMVRVTKRGGTVGVIEWYPNFLISTSTSDSFKKFNEIFEKAVYNYNVASNLERYFHSVGLTDLKPRTYLATTNSLDSEPFWRAFLVHQIPMFVHAGLISEQDGQKFVSDIEDLNKRGEFNASFIVRSVVGRK
jgi:ubiquinone/menaquinone biosynthesis C-methylase UbiE